MRVIEVISRGYICGGAEQSVSLLKSSLQARGHEVLVISSDHDEGDEHFSDIEFKEIDGVNQSFAARLVGHLWHRASYQAIRQSIKDFHPDVIHFHTMGQLSPSALFAVGGVPAILTVHGPEEYTSSLLEWYLPKKLFVKTETHKRLTALGKAYSTYFRSIQRPLYAMGFRNKLKMMVAPSKYMATTLKEESFGAPIEQIYNGIRLPIAEPPKYNDRLLYVGRLEYVKGVDVLIKAMPEIIRSRSSVQLDIVGDGSNRKELEELAEKLSVKKSVKFHGWLANEDVGKQYKNTTAVIIPSVWPENLPTVCIEALAFGKPIIGTKTGGIPELINSGTGAIVSPADTKQLASAVIALLDRDDFDKIAEKCIASAQRFGTDVFVDNIEKLYRKVTQ